MHPEKGDFSSPHFGIRNHPEKGGLFSWFQRLFEGNSIFRASTELPGER